MKRSLVSIKGLVPLALAAVIGGAVGACAASSEWPPALKTEVKNAVCARNGFDPANVDITYHPTRVPERCAHAISFRADVPEFDDAIGPVTVRVSCDSARTTVATVAVPIRVSIYSRGLVTTHRLQRFEVIGPEDIKRERFEVTRMLDWAVTDADSVIGRRVVRTIEAGQVVDRRWLADVPLIRRGERVTMTYAAGGVTASINAIAAEDGYPEQRIYVMRSGHQRLISAVVVDSTTVRPLRP